MGIIIMVDFKSHLEYEVVINDDDDTTDIFKDRTKNNTINIIDNDIKENNKSIDTFIKVLNCGLQFKTSRKHKLCALIVFIILISIIITPLLYYLLHEEPCEVDDYTKDIIPYSYDYCSFYSNKSSISDSITISDNNSSTYLHKIAFYGDSLVFLPNRRYHLEKTIQKRIQKKYPEINLNITDESIRSAHVYDFRNRMCDSIINNNYESVIMLWDSDVTSRQNEHKSKESIKIYLQTLIEIIATMKAKVKYFALSGPGIKGEFPPGYNKIDQCLDVYEQINRNISHIFNITYIDIRKKFQEYEVFNFNRIFNIPYLTLDGEHSTPYGSKIMEDLFYNQLEIWYKNEIH